MKRLNIKTSLFIGALITAVVLTVLATENLYVLHKSSAAMDAVYNQAVAPSGELIEMEKKLAQTRYNMAATMFDKVSFEDAGKQLEEVKATLPKRWDAFIKMKGDVLTEDEQKLVDRINSQMKALAPFYQLLAVAYSSRDKTMTRSVLDDDWPAVETELLAPLEQLVATQNMHIRDTHAASELNSRKMRQVVLVSVSLGALLLLLASGMTYLLIRSMDNGTRSLLQAFSRIAAGDLQTPVGYASSNEFGQMASHLEHMMERLRDMVTNMNQAAKTVAQEADLLARTVSHIEQGSLAQSNAASATSSAVQQIAVSIEQVTQNARASLDISSQGSLLCGKGLQVVSMASSEMNDIARAVASSTSQIMSLSERSNEINKISEVIRDIADQTNLLALNAAIEAARAGEQGRGFAVVADEVRKLAERTGKATNEIKQMTQAIQIEMDQTMSMMEASHDKVSKGVELARQATVSLDEIDSGARQTAQSVNEIALATNEQHMASQDIARNIEQISSMAEENSRSISRLAEAAHKLKDMARHFEHAGAQFQV